MTKTAIYVLYTGGTIGMKSQDPGNPVSPLVPADRTDLLRYIPTLEEQEGLHWDIGPLTDERGREFGPIDSSDVTVTHWLRMAATIERLYQYYDGFVILHGTDTMAYTASALSFLLENLAKPVILTGSQLPISHPRTDGVLNLVNSMSIAGYRSTNLPLVPEVCICFGDRLLRGNRARKVSTLAWQGFASPNYPDLGRIGEKIRINRSAVRPAPDNSVQPFKAGHSLNSDIMDISLFPGLKPERLAAVLKLPDIKGIIIRTYGAGNAPGNEEFLRVIAEATRSGSGSGRIIVNITQCLEGTVQQGQYAASEGLMSRGVVSGLDMTPEAALTKMMWLSAMLPIEQVRSELQIDQRGEQSSSLYEIPMIPSIPSDTGPVYFFCGQTPAKFSHDQLKRAYIRITVGEVTTMPRGRELGIRVMVIGREDEADRRNWEHWERHGVLGGEFRDTQVKSGTITFVGEVTNAVRKVVSPGEKVFLAVKWLSEVPDGHLTVTLTLVTGH